MTLKMTLTVCVSSLLCGSSFASSDVVNNQDFPTVTTLAGNGAVGFGDGPGLNASFVAPVAVSFAANGTLFVADRDAQRIRAVGVDGTVHTIAGSGSLTTLGIAVPGGFRDGAAHASQFSMPQGVLALPDGSVLVADTGNFCIRLVKDGYVTTYAGSHVQFGGADGARSAARFRNPRSLTRDRLGNIYVADWQNGVRRIDPAGNVETLRFSDSAAVTAVTIPRESPTTLLAATSDRIDVLDIHDLKVLTSVPLTSDYSHVAAREGGRPIGPVAAIAAYDADRFMTVDPLDSAVRYVGVDITTRSTYTRTLTAAPDEDAAYGSLSFLDGPGQTARFNQPLGIALAADGRIAVADVGNRRIRLLGFFDRRSHIDVDLGQSELPTSRDAGTTRIALVGNSEIWFDQAWHESVPGRLEDELNGMPLQKKVKVYPVMRFGLPPLAGLELIDETLSTGAVDAVVFDLSTYGEIVSDTDAALDFAPGFDETLRNSLTTVAQHMRQSGIPLLVVTHPGPADFPDEFEYRRLVKGDPASGGGDTLPLRDAFAVQTFHDQLQAAISSSGVTWLDLWPTFLGAYGATDRKPLFESWDHHLSPAGRALLADGISTRLAQVLAQASR